jgi:type IV pilus assembly protein PilC
MADEAENKEETTEAGAAPVEGTAPSGADAAKKADAKKAAAKKPAVKKKAPAKKPVAKAVPSRAIPLKKLDVKSLADELKGAPAEAEAPAAKVEEKPAEKPALVKAAPLKAGSGKTSASQRAALADTGGPAASAGFMSSVSKRQVTDFLRQLIMLLRAGTPILRSLQTLSKRSSNRATRALIADITQYVEAGNPLWQAFDRHPKYFDRVFVNLIRASEASGTLVTVLSRLVSYRTKQELLRKRVRGALFYPVILIIACTLVLLLLTKYVVPEFKDIFDKANIVPNAFTQWVFDVSEAVGTYWWTPYAAVFVLIVLYGFAVKKSPTAKMLFDNLKIRIPIVGDIMHQSALVDLSRTLALLIRSGVSMMQTLELTRSSVRNLFVADCLKDVRDSIERGGGMEGPLRKNSRAIPPVMTDMLVTGEESGRVDEIADQIAEIYEEEVEIKTQTLGEALQPIFTIIVGVGVIILFIALFLPLITSMDQLAGNSGV